MRFDNLWCNDVVGSRLKERATDAINDAENKAHRATYQADGLLSDYSYDLNSLRIIEKNLEERGDDN